MQKLSYLFILTFLCYARANASEISFDSCPLDGNFSYFDDEDKSGNNLQCVDRDAWVSALTGAATMLGAIATTCGLFPEPAVSKVAAPIFGTSGVVVGTISWVVSNLDCQENQKLSKEQRVQIHVETCRVLNKIYDPDTISCI